MANNGKIKVLLSVRYSDQAGREFFKGVLRYSRTHGHWQIRVVQSAEELTPEVLVEAETEGVSGLILSAYTQTVATSLDHSNIPAVLDGSVKITRPSRRNAIRYILSDEAKIGKTAAEYLASLGNFASFAYFPCREERLRQISDERGRGYISRLRAKGHPVAVYRHGSDSPTPAEWLAALPRPAAVFAPIDRHARELLVAAADAGLNVPAQLSVLGAANDDRYCLTDVPELSSVTTGSESKGYRAAELLAALLRRTKPRVSLDVTANLEPRVVVRESTAVLAPAAHLVRQAEEFIEANLERPLTIAEIAAELKVSRRLLEMRFRETTGLSLGETILSRRLEHFRERLLDSRDSIAAIARSCGFRNLPHLANLFRRRYGTTILTWRNAR